MDALKQALGIDLPTNLRGLTLASLAMLALVLVSIPLVWFFGGAVKIMGLCVTASLLCMATLFAAMSIYMGRKEANGLRQMLAGDYWAHWNYTDEEVQQFSQHETMRTRKDMRASFFFAIIFGLVVGALMGLLTRSLTVGLLAGGFAFILGIALVLQDSGRGKAYVYPGPGVYEVYIGQQGVYQPGKFGSFMFLTDVKLDGDHSPQTILFYVVTSTFSYRSTSSSPLKTANNTDPVRVGVPYGREAEAQQLVERFRALLSARSQT